MKITIEVTPEEVKEMFNMDKVMEMQQNIAKEIVKQSMEQFTKFPNMFDYGPRDPKTKPQ